MTTPPETTATSYSGLVFVMVLVVAMVFPFVQFFAFDDRKPNTDENAPTKNKDDNDKATLSTTTATPVRTTEKTKTVPMPEETNDSISGLEKKETNKDRGAEDRTNDNFNTNTWRCACEGGFLPPGLLGGAEAVLRMGTGQCYHKDR